MVSLADRPGTVFCLALVLTFFITAAWSLATPLYSGPDEGTHVVRAVALERGQPVGRTIGNAANPNTTVTVPALYADGQGWATCFGTNNTRGARCSGRMPTGTQLVVTTTYVGRYPPLYYAVAGLPSLVTTSVTGVYAMRLVSALLSSVFVALAVMCIAKWSKRRFLFIGLLLALSPMTQYLSGIVNPSGLEITSAIGLWTAGLILVERAEDPPRGLVIIATVCAVVLMLTRGLSPMWVGVIAVLLIVLAGRRAAMELLRHRSVQISVVVVGVGAVVAVAWIVPMHGLDLLALGVKVGPHETPGQIIVGIFDNTGTWFQQMVGVFGWLDTPAPFISVLAWYGAIGFLIVMALGSASRRGAGVLLGLIAVVILVPVAISYAEAHRLGIIWQARYVMPVAVGIPLLTATLIDGRSFRSVRTRIAVVIAVGVWVGETAAFLLLQRRYAVGINGVLNYLDRGWRPPLGTLVMGAWFVVSSTLFVVLVVAMAVKNPGSLAEPGASAGAAARDLPTRVTDGGDEIPADASPGVSTSSAPAGTPHTV